MNKQQRKEYSEKHTRRIKRFEAQFTRKVYTQIRRPMLEVSEVLKSSGLDAAIRRAENIIIVDGVSQLVQDIYVIVGLWSANKALREINASAREQKAMTGGVVFGDIPCNNNDGQECVVRGIEFKAGFGFNPEWTESILNYFRLFLLSKAVLPISDTTRGLILNILNKGYTEGWGIDKMAFQLERVDMPLSRARTIVRTEIGKANYFGRELAKETSEYETVDQWISAHDFRVRHSHRDVDGKQVQPGEVFRVARYRDSVIIGYDLMQGPGDPSASAENIINCRCTKSSRAKRDERGRIIRKQLTRSAIPFVLPGGFPFAG